MEDLEIKVSVDSRILSMEAQLGEKIKVMARLRGGRFFLSSTVTATALDNITFTFLVIIIISLAVGLTAAAALRIFGCFQNG